MDSIETCVDLMFTDSGAERSAWNEDQVRLENIRVLANVRATNRSDEVRNRALWSMENVAAQMLDDALQQQAQIIIMTAKRT